jgi:phosphoglucosamine mutase
MLSASHNAMPDNGIKFFSRGGLKLDDAIEDAIEQRLREPTAPCAAVGRAVTSPALELYRPPATTSQRHEGLASSSRERRGAHAAGPASSGERSATSPDGLNINEGCGRPTWPTSALWSTRAGAEAARVTPIAASPSRGRTCRGDACDPALVMPSAARSSRAPSSPP